MKPQDKERLIERYMLGELSGPEQQQFLLLLAADPELQRILDAERTVERAMKKELNGFSTDHTRTRTHALALLATIGGAGNTDPLSTSPHTVPTAGVGEGVTSGGLFNGLGTIKTVLVTLAAASGITATVFLSGVTGSSDAPRQAPTQQMSPSNVGPSDMTPSVRQDAPQTSPVPGISTRQESPSLQPQTASTPTESTRRTQQTESARRSEPTHSTVQTEQVRTAPAQVSATTETEPQQSPMDQTKDPKVYQDNSVKPNVNMQPPVLKRP